VLQMAGLPIGLTGADRAGLVEAMSWDKKVRDNELRFVVLEGIAKCVIARNPASGALRQAFEAIGRD